MEYIYFFPKLTNVSELFLLFFLFLLSWWQGLGLVVWLCLDVCGGTDNVGQADPLQSPAFPTCSGGYVKAAVASWPSC